MKSISISIILPLFLLSCSTLPKGEAHFKPIAPEYGNLDHWAAHPDKPDNSDLIPGSSASPDQKSMKADIFFVHPTTYSGKPIHDSWNAPVNNQKLNSRTDESSILYQASIFNKAGRVFAPRYRQAHIRTYNVDDDQIKEATFDLAYSDVRNAFNYYLDHYNKGRPFIIASHSQGTTHTIRLIQELVSGRSLQKKMIAAYLIGMPVAKDAFTSVSPCKNANDIECFVSWRTFKKGYIPHDVIVGDSISVHNPLSWTVDKEHVSKKVNKGAILRNFNKIYSEATDAQIYNGILWASKPKFAFSFLFTRKNYHIADFNFYYMNVRDNAANRVVQHTLAN